MDTKELTISRQTIVDQVASFLYSVGAIPHSKEIKDIEFSSLSTDSDQVKLKVKVREEVEVFHHK